MATIINNPNTDTGSGTGLIVGVIIVILLAVLFFAYGLPAIRRSNNSATPQSSGVNVNLQTTPSPTPASSANQ